MAKEILTGSKASTVVKTLNGRAVLDANSIHGLSANGKVITYTKGDGTTGTVTTQDTVYSHPTGDGNLHVPATGTTNNGKFLMAGSTAGSLSWGTPSITKANTVAGTYSANGGKQGPSYYGTNAVGFLMSNEPVNGDTHYKNWVYMDCYGGNDAGGATAIGVDRSEARAYIMQSDANRTSWNNSAELLTSANYKKFNSYLENYTFPSTPSTTATTYIYLGRWSDSSDADNLFLKIFTGDGFNGNAYQNVYLTTQIKNGWQSTNSAAAAFGVRTEYHGDIGITATDAYEVVGYCSVHNVIDVYLKVAPNSTASASIRYVSGQYTVELSRGTWTHAGTASTSVPSGTLQDCTTVKPNSVALKKY